MLAATAMVPQARDYRPASLVTPARRSGAPGTNKPCSRLRDLPATAIAPVIAVVHGRVGAEQRRTLTALGCELVLTKPVGVEQLLAAVSMSISERVQPALASANAAFASTGSMRKPRFLGKLSWR